MLRCYLRSSSQLYGITFICFAMLLLMLTSMSVLVTEATGDKHSTMPLLISLPASGHLINILASNTCVTLLTMSILAFVRVK